MMGYNYYYGSNVPYHNGGFEMFATLLFWVVIIALGVYLIKHFHCKGKRCGHGTCGGENSSAMDILKERYAKGEIEKKEFEEKKKDLME